MPGRTILTVPLLVCSLFLNETESFVPCAKKAFSRGGHAIEILNNIHRSLPIKRRVIVCAASEGHHRTKNTKRAFESWRVFGLEVHPDDMPSSDEFIGRTDPNPDEVAQRYLHPAVLASLYKRLKVSSELAEGPFPQPIRQVHVVRRSVDARQKQRSDGSSGPRFVYVVDAELVRPHNLKLKNQPGRMELLPPVSVEEVSSEKNLTSTTSQPRVVIVGAGPAGLFCALSLARCGWRPIVLERGQPVEVRGKDIGALIHRRQLNAVSTRTPSYSWSDWMGVCWLIRWTR